MSTYSYGHRKPTSSTNPPAVNTLSTRPTLARVVDIVLNSTHKDYVLKGKDKSINGIRYRLLTSSVIEGDEPFVRDQLPFAYQSNTNIKRVPVVGEIVEIYSTPFSEFKLYGFPENVHNSTLANILPDDSKEGYIADAERELKDIRKAKQLESIKGDVILEGRSGQSIRLSSFGSTRSPFVDQTSKGNPIVVIRNGQGQKTTDITVFEDINSDDSSLYLTSNHIIPLTEASTNRSSFKEPPLNADTFRGKQLIGNSDRVFLNARKDSILLSGKKSVGLNAENVNLDGSNYIGIDSPKIYLGGKQARTETQPGVLGEELTKVLNDLVSSLSLTATILDTAIANPSAIVLTLKNVAGIFRSTVQTLTLLIPKIKSKKIYIE